MDIDEFLKELESTNTPFPISENQGLSDLEREILIQKQRREHALPAAAIFEKKPNFEEEQSKRNIEIRNFLRRTTTQKEYQKENTSATKFSSTKVSTTVHRYISDVRGIPLSVTSALTGDRVYCSQRTEPLSPLSTIPVKESRPILSVDEIAKEIEATTIRTPPRTPEAMEITDPSMSWLQKYTPKTFSDLLTDDTLNREVMKWLKAWKPILPSKRRSFGNEGKKLSQGSTSKKSSTVKLTQYFLPETPSRPSSSETNVVKTPTEAKPFHTHSEHKVLMICGPTGVGKTSLVKIAARMCNYYPFVIYPEDLNSETMDDFIGNLLESESVFKSVSKCLIFEGMNTLIPGAECRKIIQKIMQFIEGKHKSNGYLKRPMIFICNEIHASFMFPLRQRARILYVPQPKINKNVVNCLQKICFAEGLSVNLTELQNLVEEMRNDITGCLTALELRSKCQAIPGIKMAKQTPFRIWESILTPPNDVPFSELFGFYEHFGDYDLVVTGIFTNYVRLHLADGNFKKRAKIAEDISRMHHFVWKCPSYCPVLFIAVRRLAQSLHPSGKIEWPKEAIENVKQRHFNQQAINAFLRDLSPQVSLVGNRETFVVDVFPYLTKLTLTGMSSKFVQHALSGECKIRLLDIIQKNPNTTTSAMSEQSLRSVVPKRAAESVDTATKKVRQEGEFHENL